MANNPTIVAASLSDQDLKNSIDKLVKHVDDATKNMAKSMDSAVEQMKRKLGELGNVKIDFGGTSSSGGTKKSTNDQKNLEEQTKRTTNAIKEQKMTLDQTAQAMQQAVAPKSARESYYAFFQGFKEQAQGIAQYIKAFETGLNNAIQNRYNELNLKLSESKSRIKQLNDELARRHYAAGNPEAVAQVQAQLEKELRTHNEIQKAIANVNQEFAFEKTYLASLYAEHHRVSNIMIEETNAKRSSAAATQQEVTEEKKRTEELRRQLQSINEIESRKSATLAMKSITSMESTDLDKAESKLAALKALKEKVKNTDLLSQKSMTELDSWIKYTTTLVDRLGQKTSKNVREDEDAIRRAAEAERLWTDKIRQRGQVAQETSRKIIQMLYEESQAGGKGLMGFYKVDGKDINAVRDLQNAIKEMQQQYNIMSDTEKESAIGKMLKRDIENAKAAAGAISAYNKAASGVESNARDAGVKSVVNYETLRNVLKELTQQYNAMNIAEIKAGSANFIVDKIQRTNRELQQLQNRMNRPISLDAALKGSERTLDDIAYKMQRLNLYKQSIDLTKPGADVEIQKVDEKLQQLQRDADKWLSKSKNMIDANNALGRSWNYMKNRLAFYFTVGASTQFVKNLIEIRSQYEMNERALGILINSAERGTQIFKELSDMALVSPYTLIELSSAAKQLTAYDIAAKNVVDTTRRLADMASAVGVPMERLTYALGQIKAYGYLNSRDARMFANAGIPLVKELSKYYSELEGRVVSVGDVYDRMKKKAIDFNSVMSVVTKMTDEGGKFFDFQAKMADTLKVRLANLTLAWNNMLNEMGQSSQGVLTSGIGALKDLFLHWKDIESAMQKVIWALGLWKAAQAIGLIYIGELNTKMGAQILLGKKLGTTLASAAASTKSFVSGYAMAASALLMVIADIIVTSQRNAEEIQRLNKTIADGAKEASESMYNFIHSTEMVSARMSAMQGKLSATDATKTWEALREQIELSAMSNKQLIDQLLLIPDMNKRVSEAFTLAESIQEATNKLTGLDNELKVTQDSILWGLFGEGLAEDIDDFNARLERSAATEKLYFESTGSLVGDVIEGFKGFFSDMKEKLGSSREEAEREIRNFAINAAEAIREELGEEGLKDKVQINEAVARALQAVEQTFPQIKGKGKVLFETMFNDIMAKEFEGSVDRQAYYYNKFLEQLKKDHGSAFGDVTDEVLKDTHQWSSAQLDAINKTADKLKEDLPAASQDAIDRILAQLNSTEFKVRIVAEMATTSVGEVEEKFNEKFIKKPWIEDQKEREKAENEAAQKYGNLRRKATESNVEYEKRISDERQKQLELQQKNADIIRANKNNQDEYSKAVVKDAEKAKESADAWLKASDEVEKAGGYDFSTKKERSAASKAQKTAETELQKTLKEELKLIDEVRSQYKKLTDAGVSRAVAMKTVTEQFGDSISHINAVLGKNGMPKFDIKSFAGTDNPHEMMVMLKKQIDAARSVSNIKSEDISELEIKYSKIKVDAEVYDATMIKKGLDNELGRLKDEYELAVELDANPELGGIFADMFDIDLDAIPRTAREYAEMYTKSLNKYFKEMKTDIELPNMLNLTRNDMEAFTEQLGTGELQKVYFDLIQNGYEATRAALKKEETDAINEYQKLIQKYSEYQYKITQIAKQANNERKALVVQFGNEQQKEEARKIVKNLDVEKDPQKIEELNNQLSELIEQVAGDNELTVQLSLSIDNKEAKAKAKALWDNFKNSDSYTIMFDDLKRASTGALNQLGESFEDIKPKIKESPEAMKELMNAYKQLREELTARDPFGAMVTSMERMRKASADVEIAEKELDDANKTVKKNEDQLALLRKTEPKNIKAIEAAEKNLTKAKKDASEKQKNLTNAQNKQVAAKDDYKKALSESAKVIDKLGQSISSVGSQIEGTSGQILQLIGDIMSFVKTVSDGIISTSETASRALQAIETASVILMIISAAIKIIQQISSLLSDSYGEYEKFAEKQAEINKLKDSVVEYQMAVLEARMEEENWFSTSNLKKLKNYYKIGSDAIDAYKDKLFQAQAVYENESGSGWLTKLGAQANRTWASITGAVNELIGIEGTFIGDLATNWAQFGWANAAGGMIGMNMYLENLLWNKKYDKSYEEGLIAAWQNLRIETREASKGFLGTGVGGHNQETRDLIEWAREELGMDLFLEDLTLNEEAYKVIMDEWADKLVGETKDTLEALHEYTEKWKEYIEQLEEYVDSLYSPLIDNMSDAMWDWFDDGKNALDSFKEYSKKTFRDIVSDMMKTIMLSNFGNKYAEDISDLYTEYVKGGMSEKQLIEKVGVRTNELMDSFQNNIPVLEEVMNTASQVFKQYGIELKDVAEESSLSALQQGIQGITEDTAGAIEAYMNGISQQIYYQSDLLTEIRDVLVSGSTDIQAGVQAQMLFELQQSYQVQMVIQNILDGWSSPNGQSVRVEMIN